MSHVILWSMAEAAVLAPDEVVPGKPFTDPEHTDRDAAAMRELLARERERARAWAGQDTAPADEIILVEQDEHDHRHLLVVPDPQRLLEAENPTVVGFFGRPREDVDHAILFELEEQLVAAMPSYGKAGLLSYYDVELVKGSYGNLILFSTPDVPPEWHDNPLHLRAIDVSPGHYHGIRLHKGTLQGRLLDGGDLTLERTKYVDFEGEEPWRAVRPVA
jgi:hypothetical protein